MLKTQQSSNKIILSRQREFFDYRHLLVRTLTTLRLNVDDVVYSIQRMIDERIRRNANFDVPREQ